MSDIVSVRLTPKQIHNIYRSPSGVTSVAIHATEVKENPDIVLSLAAIDLLTNNTRLPYPLI